MRFLEPILILLLFVIGSVNSGFSQEDEAIKANILTQAKLVSQAALDADFETIFEYTHPSAARSVGGKENFMDLLTNTYRQFEEQDVEMLEMEVSDSIVFAKQKNVYHALVPKVLKLRVKDKTFISNSYLFGFSDDGEKWTFVEADKLRPESEKRSVLFPDFETTLTIPAKSRMILIESVSDETPVEMTFAIKEFFLGGWSGDDEKEIGSMFLDSEGFVSFTIRGQPFGGKDFDLNGQRGAALYIIDDSLEPILIDILVRNLETQEQGKLLGIISIQDSDSFMLALAFDGVRPTEMNDENSILMTRIIE